MEERVQVHQNSLEKTWAGSGDLRFYLIRLPLNEAKGGGGGGGAG